MHLTADQRVLLRKSIQLLDQNQADIAKELNIKPSALSDALRAEGKRPIPDHQLAELLRIVQTQLEAKRGLSSSASGMHEFYLQQLDALRADLFGSQFSSFVPGPAIPQTLKGRVVLPAQFDLANQLSFGGWQHVFAGPKMGASSLATLAHLLADGAGYFVSHLKLDPATHACSSVRDVLLRLYAEITSDEARVPELKTLADEGLVQNVCQRFRFWISAKAREPNFKRILIVVDNLDALIGEEIDVNDFFEQLGPLFVFLSELSEQVTLLTFSTPFARAGLQSISKYASAFVAQAACKDILPFDRSANLTLCRSLRIDYEETHFQAASKFASGNVFLTHLFAFMIRRQIPCDEAEEHLKKLYAGVNADLGVPEQGQITRSIRQHHADLLRAWDIFRRVLLGAKVNDLTIENSIKDLCAGTIDPNDPVYEWARRTGLVNIDRSLGVLRPVLEQIQQDLRKPRS